MVAATSSTAVPSDTGADVVVGCGTCDAVALAALPAEEDPDSVLKPGEIDEDVTGYRVNKKTGAGRFCSHGGYCYPRFATVNGQRREVLQLRHCAVGKPYDYNTDADEDVDYEVGVPRGSAAARKCPQAGKDRA